MKNHLKIAFGAVLAFSLAACGGGGGFTNVKGDGPNVFTAETAYTLTNLHPDPQRKKLYAVNYQQGGLIPYCTPVKFVELDSKRVAFEIKETGIKYYYDYHNAAAEPFPDHLQRFFGTSCQEVKNKVKSLSQTDKEGIEAGEAKAGMTKDGVAIALGYPPRHVTPTLDMDQWTYWANRFNRFIVHFDDQGVVTDVQQ
jgi:hypothetical protein